MKDSMEHSETDSNTVPITWQYTRCPECEAVFRVDQSKLSVRQGEVRCGACRNVFHAPSNKVFRNHGGGFSALITEAVEQDQTVEKMIATRESIEGELEIPENDPFSAEFTAPIDPVLESSSLFSDKPDEDVDEPAGSSRLFSDIELEENAVTNQGGVSEPREEQEIGIPKISSEPLISRASRDVEDVRKEPALSTERKSGTLEKEPLSTAPFESETMASVAPGVSKLESVEEARESLLFQPLSAETGRVENSDSVDSATLSSDSVGISKWRDAEVQPFGASAMPMPPKFEPLVTAPDEARSEPVEIPPSLASDQWNEVEDSLLDHNPFPPPGAEPTGAVSEIRVEPKPAAINMSGVDEYIVDRPNPLAGFFWFLVSAAFVVLLGLQVKYFFVERFAQNESYRPYLQIFCGVARCELPPRRDAYRFTITQTRVDLHPQEPGALRITVRLLNQAKFAQPYPELRLTLTDRVGRVVGRRKFHPDFYLPRGAATRLSSGELGYVVFDLARPHEKAVGFVVDVVRRTS